MTRRDDEPFGDVFEQMDEMMRRIQEQMFGDIDGDGFVGGYSVTQRPGEEPDVTTFGDVPGADGPAPGPAAEPSAGGSPSDTHVEVHHDDDVVRVVGDLPGVAKDDIDLSATADRLHVTAENDDRSYDETVALPARVEPDSATASFNNGVLEVELAVDEDTSAKDIDIE